MKSTVMTNSLCRWFSLRVSKFPNQLVKTERTKGFAGKILGFSTLGISIVKCQSKLDIKNLKLESLTREECIKQACLLSVNSASTLLTTTSSAVLDICKEYKNSLNRIIFLLEEFQNIEGENPQLWDAIVEARANVNRAKAALTELNCYMESVEKVVNSTTEAAFLAGAEYVCTALCERFHLAQREINDQIVELKKLEENYVKIQTDIASAKGKEKDGKKKPQLAVNERANDKQILHQ